MNIRMKDSKGSTSTTLTLVTLGLLVLMLLTIKQIDEVQLVDFATAWMLILGPWVAREVKVAVQDHYRGDK